MEQFNFEKSWIDMLIVSKQNNKKKKKNLFILKWTQNHNFNSVFLSKVKKKDKIWIEFVFCDALHLNAIDFFVSNKTVKKNQSKNCVFLKISIFSKFNLVYMLTWASALIWKLNYFQKNIC